MRVSMAAERSGIPAVSIIATGFIAQASAFARGLGVSDPPLAEYPGVPMVDSDEELRAKVVEKIVPQVLAGFHRQVSANAAAGGEPGPRDIVFCGSLEQVQDYFIDQQWSDG